MMVVKYDINKEIERMEKNNTDPNTKEMTLKQMKASNIAYNKIDSLVRSLPDIVDLKECEEKEWTIEQIVDSHYNNMSLYKTEDVGMGTLWHYRWGRNRRGNIPFVVDTISKYLSQDNTPRRISWDMVESNFNIGILSKENLKEIRRRVYYNNNLILQVNGEFMYTITENEYENKIKECNKMADEIRKIEKDYMEEEQRLRWEYDSVNIDDFF